jgi:hypothetical protein
MSKIKKLLEENTVIVWGSIPVGEYRKFFEQAISKEFAGDKNFQTWLFTQAGKTLKEATEYYFNPSGQKNMEEFLSERRFNIISDSDKTFIIAFDKAINELGYNFGGVIGSGSIWGRNMISYGKTGTASRPIIARIYIREESIVLRLFLNKVDTHRQYIENAPTHIKEVFSGTHSSCNFCHDKCNGRKEYTLDGRLIYKCSGSAFEFFQPSMEKLLDYVHLLTEFYPNKKITGTKK